ncbi:MAG: sodium:solute symporter family protein [Ruminococcaceae bacterium]|nr:sodium:solute symporter family protein [Oscillospiraceae bacterium]
MDKLAIWLTIGVYIVLMAVIGITQGKKAKSIADLTVGGRNAGAWLSALSYGTAYFSAVMFVGYAGGTGKSYALWGILAGIGNAVFGSWLAWKVLARRTRDASARLKIKTMPQFLDARYTSEKMKLFACLVIFVFLIPYSASVYKGLASVAEVLLGINVEICMIIIAVVAALLLVFGGYLVQARADFMQGIVMMFGVTLLIVCVIRCDAVGGFSGLAEYAKNLGAQPSAENGLPTLTASQWISLWATVLMTSFGTWGLPQMVTKYFGIKDDKQAKKGISISTFFAFLVAGGGYFIGSLCYRYFTYAQLNDPAAEGYIAQDYIVPNMLAESNLPSVLLGIVLVLLIAASVSTLCSVTLTASSTLTIDFIKHFKKDMGEKKSSFTIKVLCVIFIVCSYIIANTDTAILDMMSYSWGIISGSFLAPYVLSLYWKKINTKGAWAAILGGFAIAVVPAAAKIISGFAANDTVTMLAGKGPVFACIAMIASLVLCVVVSAATKSTNEKETEFFYNGEVAAE